MRFVEGGDFAAGELGMFSQFVEEPRLEGGGP